MARYQTRTIYYVCALDTKTDFGNGEIIQLVKQQDPYNGHETYELAVKWIEEQDNRGQYTIIQVFKRV